MANQMLTQALANFYGTADVDSPLFFLLKKIFTILASNPVLSESISPGAPIKTKGYIIRGVAVCSLGSTVGSNSRRNGAAVVHNAR